MIKNYCGTETTTKNGRHRKSRRVGTNENIKLYE
jgi:hypothetical protein